MVHIPGKNQDERLNSGIGVSENTLKPFLTGSLEFGYDAESLPFGEEDGINPNDEDSRISLPFDEENRVYPTSEQLAKLDPSHDMNLI